MKKKLKIIIIVIFMLSVITFSFWVYRYEHVKTTLAEVNLSKANSLMIVAHPDDETIWGGAHLLKGKYLVVCVTCGTKRVRFHEFKKALSISGDQYIALGYPDKVLGVRSNWENEIESLRKDLEEIIKAKKWKTIATHNLDGEYGHEHHAKISGLVTSIYDEENIKSELYLFGRYYTKDDIKDVEDTLKKIDPPYRKDKQKMLDVYKSQASVKKKFSHMFDYEEWTLYEGPESGD